MTAPIRIFNRYPGACPPVQEGGGPWLRPHRVFLGWAVLGAVGGLLLHHTATFGMDAVTHTAATVAGGYVLLSALGLLLESASAWIARDRRRQKGGNPRKDRIDCHLVEIAVDSYVFGDGSGKAFDPDAAFKGRGPAFPAHVSPSSFVFAQGEAYRDVVLHVDAPDQAGPPEQFNVSVRQGGVPSGGVTITITTGGK